MAYWGEAMSHNHPLWAQQDDRGREDDPRKDRADVRRAPGESEAAEGESVPQGDRHPVLRAGRQARARHRRTRMRWPRCMRSGRTITKSRRGTRCRCSAPCGRPTRASAARRSPRRSPRRCSRKTRSIRARRTSSFTRSTIPITRRSRLTAARSYAGIAPAAAHALHMPSHIFVQRGMWEDVRKSNIVAYKSATELNARMKLAEGREDFHTLGWLQYANLMLGNIDEAKANVESAKQAADRNPAQRRHSQRLSRHARAADSRNREVGKDRARCAGRTRCRRCARRHARHGDMPPPSEQHVDVHRRLQRGEAGRSRRPPERAVAMLRGGAREGRSRQRIPTRARPIAIMEKQVGRRSSAMRGARRTKR